MPVHALPLPQGFFRCPPLTPDDIRKCTELGESISADLIRSAQLQGGPIRWVLNSGSSESELQIYSGDDPTAPRGVRTFCAVTQVKATTDDVAAHFRTNTTEEYRAFCRQYAVDIQDALLLYTIAKPTAAFPRHNIAIKWAAYDIFGVPFGVKLRDSVFLECHHDCDVQGRRGWVRSIKSIDLSCCPDLQATLNLVRGSFYRVGMVAMETDVPGVLQVTCVMQIDFQSKLPSFFVTAAVHRWMRGLGMFQMALWERKLAHGRFLTDDKLIPQDARGRCFLCQRRFGPFLAKESCRKCGQVVCRNCCRDWRVALRPGDTHHVPACICFVCTKRKVAPAPPKTPTTTATRTMQSTMLHPSPLDLHVGADQPPRWPPELVVSREHQPPSRRRGASLPQPMYAAQWRAEISEESLLAAQRHFNFQTSGDVYSRTRNRSNPERWSNIGDVPPESLKR
ncbi:Aste57867_9789 [Aphanomyces stellatus]|uniref:Aste57867_9789 protein n=1 Tax=Aphanomyces stellatus TaxID=120398 RepID=A0A485KNR7_9STRA|nr:hypothetical protein As57867_009750 [Aphanomyces stellatus]VFT86668.1 Aste57867_9789 [Aphanomyces stellatus]